MIDKRISSPEPDKDLREKYQAQRTTKSSTCLFDNPESATSVLKVKRLDGDTIYYFNSQYQKQILGVTIHPGDVYSQVSIFQVKYATSSKTKTTPLAIDHFATEKDIKLGWTKSKWFQNLAFVIR